MGASLSSLWGRRGGLFIGRKEDERRRLKKIEGSIKFHYNFTLPVHLVMQCDHFVASSSRVVREGG